MNNLLIYQFINLQAEIAYLKSISSDMVKG